MNFTGIQQQRGEHYLKLMTREIAFTLGKTETNKTDSFNKLEINQTAPITLANNSFVKNESKINQAEGENSIMNPFNHYHTLNSLPVDQTEANLNKNSLDNYEGIRFNTGRWQQEEHQKFIEAMFLYGNEWKRVQEHIVTRSATQARSHAQKFFIRLRKRFLEENVDITNNGVSQVNYQNQNEKLINLIRENVNCDILSNLLKSQQVSNFLSSNTPENLEQFITDRKNKFCQIVMNLINASTKSKKQNVSKTKSFYSPNQNQSGAPHNNFISIVTINMGVNECTVQPNPNENEPKSMKEEECSSGVNYNVSNMSNRLLLKDYQKIMKMNGDGPCNPLSSCLSNQNNNPNSVSLNEFNVPNSNRKQNDEHPNGGVDKPGDPFKLSFGSENDEFSFNFPKNEESDISKLNLDLDHIFNLENNFMN